VYFDNAATTRPAAGALAAMQHAQQELFGNPSSPHGFGRKARAALEEARELVRGTLGAARVVFTSGGTEADLLGVFGAVRARAPGRVLAGVADHPAILAQAEMLALAQHRLATVPVARGGDLDPGALRERLAPDVRAVAVLHGHNELGSLSALDEIVAAVRAICPDAHIHVDLVQSYGKIPFDLDAAGVDSVAVSGHKLHAPRGIGCLALSSKARAWAVQRGGGQEGELRGGTENVAGAIALACAAEDMLSRQAHIAARTAALCERMLAGLRAHWPQAERLGNPQRRLPHILSVRLPDVAAAALRERAAARGLAFSTGAACHGDGGAQAGNPVLEAIGLSRRQAREVMRFSFCEENTPDEVDRAVAILAQEAALLAGMAPARQGSRPDRAPS
jgi:cysteine desulfurase